MIIVETKTQIRIFKNKAKLLLFPSVMHLLRKLSKVYPTSFPFYLNEAAVRKEINPFVTKDVHTLIQSCTTFSKSPVLTKMANLSRNQFPVPGGHD